MIRLLRAELRKLCCNRLTMAGLAVALACNLFFQWSYGTRSAVPPAGYRKAGEYLASVDTREAAAWLEQQSQELAKLQYVEDMLHNIAAGGALSSYSESDQLLWEEYREVYAAGEYLLFTSNLTAERRLVQELYGEAKTVAEYPLFLEQIQQRAAQLGAISIFQTDPWNQQVTQASARAYAGMENTVIAYCPQKGLLQALNFGMSDLLLLGCMLLLAFGLVRWEADSGMLRLVRSAPAGRWDTAAAKLLALLAALGGVVLALYGSNLLFCSAVYGLGPLSRSIQSAPGLMKSTLPLTVGQYIGLFLVVKWAAACVAGVWVMLACLLARRAVNGYLLAAGFFALCYGLRAAVPAAGKLGVLRYANPVSLLQTNELLGEYYSLYWFGQAIPRTAVETAAAAGMLAVFAGAFLWVFSTGRFAAGRAAGPRRARAGRKVRFVPLWRQECYKIFVLQGAAVVLAGFFVWQGIGLAGHQSYLLPEEVLYQRYMTRLAGPYDQGSYEEWEQILAELEPYYNPETRTDSTPSELTLYYQNQVLQQRVFPKLYQVAQQAEAGAQMVYESGYLYLLRLQEDLPSRQTQLIGAVLCALCLAGVFGAERATGMEKLLGATPGGRSRTVKIKLAIGGSVAAAVWLGLYLPRLAVALLDYGLPAADAGAWNLEAFQAVDLQLPLAAVLALDFGCGLLGCGCMALLTMALGYLCGNVLGGMAASSAVLALPVLLDMAGVSGARWLGCYPLFCAGELLAQPGGGWFLCFSAVLWAGLSWLCIQGLLGRFGRGNRDRIRLKFA